MILWLRWLSVALLFVLVFVFLPIGSLLAEEKRPITVEDAVRTRRLPLEEPDLPSPIQLSPDGTLVAYVVKGPNVSTNRNEYQLYLRGTVPGEVRENGRLILKADGISGIHWLGAKRFVAEITKNSETGAESELAFVDAAKGRVNSVSLPRDVKNWTISQDGKTIVFSQPVDPETPTPGQAAEKKSRDERGYAIAFGKGLDNQSTSFFPAYEIFLGHISGKGLTSTKKLFFTGPGNISRRSSLRGVMQLNLSPDGNRLLITYEAESTPEGWEDEPYIKELRSLGAPVSVMGLYEIRTGKMRLGFNFQGDLFRATWAEDSRAYSVVSPSPFGTAEGRQEDEEAVAWFGRVYVYFFRFAHLFVVDAETGRVTKVVYRDSGEPGNWKFAYDGPMAWKQSDGEMIVRAAENTFARMKWSAGSWQEADRFEVSHENQDWSMFASDGRSLFGLQQGLNTPPDLFVLDMRTGKKALLTDLNPEYTNIALGEIEKIEWTNRYGSRCTGKLIKPVGYRAGTPYPLVILASDFDNDFFISDSPNYTTAFAPQPLANAGFAVLMAKYAREDKSPHGEFPGDMGDVYNWISMMESAIDLLVAKGIATKDNVGMVGFSHTSGLTDFMLTHSSYPIRAASSADSGIFMYGNYFKSNLSLGMKADETQVGGPPYGKTQKLWLEYAPPFNADKVQGAVLMEYTGTAEHGLEFFVALSRLGKPVELYRYPKGDHPLDTPFERVASLQRNVDWFRFWMQGEEGTPPAYDPEQFVRWRALRARQGKGGSLP